MDIGYLQLVKKIIKSLIISSPQSITIDNLNKDYKLSEGEFIPFKKLGFQNLEIFLRSIPDTVQVLGRGPTATVVFIPDEKSAHIYEMVQTQKKSKSYRPNKRYQNAANSYQQRCANRYRRAPLNVPRQLNVPDTGSTNPANPCKSIIRTRYDGTRSRNFQNKPQVSETAHVSVKNNLQSDVATANNRKYKDNCTISYAGNRDEMDQINRALKKTVRISEQHMEAKILQKDEDVQHFKNNIIRSESATTKNISLLKAPTARCKYENIPEAFQIGSSEDIFQDLNEAIPAFAANNVVYSIDFPANSVTFGTKIEDYKLPKDIQPGSVIGIFISEIHSPSRFWFHIHKENHELDILMHKIERFYMRLLPEDFQIPLICITPGQFCAALFNDIWHRGQIVLGVNNNRAKVLFIDYGTVSSVDVSHIKYLADIFASVPRQAIRGCLSHIRPNGLHWSHEATKYFLSKVTDLMIYALVSEVDDLERVLYMVLCDTNDNENVQINKILIEKGFAVYNENWHQSKIQQAGQRVRYQHEDFPQFSMIENGLYPSLSELVELENNGTCYENIYDRVLFHPDKLNEHENAPEIIRNLPFNLFSTNPFRKDIILHSLK